MDNAPERIGKYDILRELGRGSTSRVFLGRDGFAGREVAIKVFEFTQELKVDPRARSMRRKGFLKEAALAGRLTHPHIVEIYDAASEDKMSYVVMEYVAGGTLDAHADAQNLLPLGRVVEIVFKCARALDAAMRAGVIHRDIKPGNILLTADGDIKISDFGAALLARGGSDFSASMTGTSDTIVGSPAYMSPEQISNESLNHQSDIYSLGVVMYRLLTGRLPFTATNHVGLAYAILNTDPPRPSELRTQLPKVLDTIIAKAMAQDRALRYQTWADFGRDLTQAFIELRATGEAASDSEQFQALRALPFFADFDDVELWEMVRISTWIKPARGEFLIREGDQGDALYVLVEGEADVSIRGQKVSAVKRGGCFGEMLYFQDSEAKRGTTIVAQTDCDVIEIKAGAMRAATDGVQAEFNKACMRVLLDRIGNINARFAMLKATQE